MTEAGVVERAVRFALSAVGARQLEARPADRFYEAPADIPDRPGELLKAEPGRFYIDPFRLVPAPARVERIMFTTTDRLGSTIPVTGTVMTPTRPRTKRDDRGLVAFAVGTQGMGTQCAPSRQMAAGREYESVFITGLLARGYNVVVPDYQGLGMRAAGQRTHTYMSRQVQGHVVLDALRAAQSLSNPDIPLDGPTAIAGYSQGGGAAASAAEIAHEYAPDLDVRGAVCGAVPADFPLVARMLDGSPYFAFLGYALVGLSSDYGVDLRPLLNERGVEVATALSDQCMFESLRRYAFTRSNTLTADGRSIGSMLREEPFATIVAEQKLGDGRYPRTEALVSHSRLDDVVPFECGRALAERWAGQGARVRFSVNVAPTHAAAALTSYGTAFAFLNGRFAGRPMRANTKRYLHGLVQDQAEEAGPT
ncbi:MAG: lipase family protein [Marmoricola sp.]